MSHAVSPEKAEAIDPTRVWEKTYRLGLSSLFARAISRRDINARERSAVDHDESNERVIQRKVMGTSDGNWDFANLTEAEYLDKILGPKHLPMKLVIPLTIVYVTVFVSGIFGNFVTCTVIVRNASMQTATNYYLFSLAISDLTLLILGERITQMLSSWPPWFGSRSLAINHFPRYLVRALQQGLCMNVI